MRRGPSPISKRIRIINNKFRELWDKNLLKYNLTGMQMEILCYLKCNPDKEIHQREIEYWFQLKNPTVTGILNRLEEKGWVRSAKQGNCNVYVPLVTRRAYGVYCMRQRLDTLFDGDLAAAVHALVSESGCSQSALEQAIRMLEEKHQETEEYDLYDPYG